MKTIVNHFTVTELRALFTYNPETGQLFWIIKSGRVHPGSVAGSSRVRGTVNLGIKGRSVLAHRAAWALYYGEWPALQIDHINGNPADNRITNLRLATNSQNQANIGARSTNRSGGIKGIRRQASGKWRADISVNGVKRYLGTFASSEIAVSVYNSAAQAAHGEFAKISGSPI